MCQHDARRNGNDQRTGVARLARPRRRAGFLASSISHGFGPNESPTLPASVEGKPETSLIGSPTPPAFAVWMLAQAARNHNRSFRLRRNR